jgi:ERCC4-type nuclease
MDDMVDWLSSVHHNLRIRRKPTAEPTETTRRGNRKVDLRVRVLAAIDGISERAAHDLLTEFGSIPRLLRSRTSQRKLMEIEGIGRKRAKAILSLRERYPDQPDRQAE